MCLDILRVHPQRDFPSLSADTDCKNLSAIFQQVFSFFPSVRSMMYGYGDAEPQQIYSETVDLIEVTYKSSVPDSSISSFK